MFSGRYSDPERGHHERLGSPYVKLDLHACSPPAIAADSMTEIAGRGSSSRGLAGLQSPIRDSSHPNVAHGQTSMSKNEHLDHGLVPAFCLVNTSHESTPEKYKHEIQQEHLDSPDPHHGRSGHALHGVLRSRRPSSATTGLRTGLSGSLLGDNSTPSIGRPEPQIQPATTPGAGHVVI